MNTEKSVTRRDVGCQNFEISIREIKHPLGIPVSMLGLIFFLVTLGHRLFYFDEIVIHTASFSSVALIHSVIAVFFILALCVVYRWSRKSSYDKFCDWFYDESRKWSYAGLTVSVLLAVCAFLIQNALVLNSLEEASQPFIIFSLQIPYPSVLFITWQVLTSLLFFMVYFRIDRSTDITDSANKGFFYPMFTFVFAPLFTAFVTLLSKVEGFPKFLSDWALLGTLTASTVSTFFIWAFISRIHASRNTEKELRKSLRRYIFKRWNMCGTCVEHVQKTAVLVRA